MDFQEEQDLIQKAQREAPEDQPGADAAFTKLYEFYLPKIYGYIYKRVGKREIAEDLTSQTFLKMVENLKRFRGRHFKSWLFKIATNSIIDYYRMSRPAAPITEYEDLPENSPGPVQQTEQMQNREKVLAVLALLPEKYQRVLHLKFFADLSNEELAVSLKITENNLGVLIYRALKSFKKLYNKHLPYV